MSLRSHGGAGIYRLLPACLRGPVSDSKTCPIPLPRGKFRTQAPAQGTEQGGGLGHSGRPVWEVPGSVPVRKADNAFLPGSVSPAHFPGRQAGRKHPLTKCPMQAGTSGFVSLYP